MRRDLPPLEESSDEILTRVAARTRKLGREGGPLRGPIVDVTSLETETHEVHRGTNTLVEISRLHSWQQARHADKPQVPSQSFASGTSFRKLPCRYATSVAFKNQYRKSWLADAPLARQPFLANALPAASSSGFDLYGHRYESP